MYTFLPPANEVWDKIIFSQASVILFTEGHAWHRGTCMTKGDMHGEEGHVWQRGECMVKGVVWQRGACVARGCE